MNDAYTLFPSVTTKNHRFNIPLDHKSNNSETINSETIEVFARELILKENIDKKLPYLVFLQGGPGFGSPRPTGLGGWINRALQEYRVLLLD